MTFLHGDGQKHIQTSFHHADVLEHIQTSFGHEDVQKHVQTSFSSWGGLSCQGLNEEAATL